MKTIILLLVLIVSALIGSVTHYMEPSVPTPISIQAPTEKGIKEEIRFEQKQKQYRKASQTAARIYRSLGCRATYADATGRIAVDFGLSPRLLAGLVFVESTCNPNAVSGRDSVGLTQINPKVWHYSRKQLKDPETNLRIGAQILKNYVNQFGLVEGLHHYNGLGNPSSSYAEKVLAAAGFSIPQEAT